MPIHTRDEIRARLGDVEFDVTTAEQVASWLPPEPPDAHKGTFGSALVVAGSISYTGAAYLAAAAAYRAGAGLVTAAVPAGIHPIVATLVPEATFLALSEDLGVVARPGAKVVRDAWHRYQALLLGPGLTTQRPAAEFVEALLAPADDPSDRQTSAIGFGTSRRADPAGAPDPVPVPDPSARARTRPARWVVDADGLNLLAAWPAGRDRLPPESVLTPHPGEMARLVGRSTAEVNADRLGSARKAAEEWGHVVVLKGAFSVVAAPDGRLAVNPFASPALATAGSGDVLAGTITGLLAQGMPAFEAAAAGAFIHALAGDLAAAAVGGRGTTAGDVLANIAGAIARVEEGGRM
jgi:ADP-dependent NAD(P)H-hydrate dehydratase / NAD(P)H-hydrate epimerase